jgi:MraZ protein
MGKVQRFRGSYDVKVDDRGRIKIPSRFLSVFDSGYGRDVYITSLNGDHVMLYPIKIWEDVELRVESIGVWDPDVDEFVSRLSYWGTETEIDPKGRVLIPPDLRKASKLEEVIRILGKANHLVIWNEGIFKSKEIVEEYGKDKLHRVSRILNEVSPLSGDE